MLCTQKDGFPKYVQLILLTFKGLGFIYLFIKALFTAQVLKICRTPGPTAYQICLGWLLCWYP